MRGTHGIPKPPSDYLRSRRYRLRLPQLRRGTDPHLRKPCRQARTDQKCRSRVIYAPWRSRYPCNHDRICGQPWWRVRELSLAKPEWVKRTVVTPSDSCRSNRTMVSVACSSESGNQVNESTRGRSIVRYSPATKRLSAHTKSAHHPTAAGTQVGLHVRGLESILRGPTTPRAAQDRSTLQRRGRLKP